ncbi:large ribosomal subunit protein mL64 [Heteronotia binoei]|uniref:large ribosomal subunit protein mL64 n=1 Tax=Heteronotia binoei TaxID=13085 RepID=UPI00293160A9|nr:large ribosomal subunit protein mL64 [Heteronotia binoei]
MAAAMATRCEPMAALRRLFCLGGVRAYNARQLRLHLGGVRLPDPADPRTPAWKLEPAYEAKLYGRYGAASLVDPARLWPSPPQRALLQADEAALCPALAHTLAALRAARREEARRRREREELIAARMAKMPQMIADWRREKEERKAKEEQEKERRQQLLAEARERLGYNVDHRSPEFQEMMQEMEKARRKELKLQKKQRREQAVAKKAEDVAAAAAASQLAKEGEAEAAASPCQDT